MPISISDNPNSTNFARDAIISTPICAGVPGRSETIACMRLFSTRSLPAARSVSATAGPTRRRAVDAVIRLAAMAEAIRNPA